jgi:hypothetical protein
LNSHECTSVWPTCKRSMKIIFSVLQIFLLFHDSSM